VGGTYVDGNFGATVKLISSFSASHGYSTPSAFSASGKYVALAQNGIQVNVVETATGNAAYTGRPGYVTSDTIRWDSYSDDVYYFFRGAQVVRHKLSTNTTTVLVDYSTDGHGFSGISGGGTGDISKDNWIGFWADTQHQVCILDLNKVVTYCAGYYATYPNNRVPVNNVDFVHVSRGVDSISGKRYVLLMSNPAIMVFSVDQTAAKLAYEFRGPEVPTDFQVGKTGNKDGICDAGETCLSGYHSDMMEDSQGRQYLVYVADIETPCQRQITTSLLSAGPKLLISVAQGGGRTDVNPLHLCGGGPIELWAENHTSCARRAPFCAVSTNYTLPRDPADLTTPVNRSTHLSEIMVMRENGVEIRRVAQTRSFQFTNDSYWSFARASISHDGSAVLWDSNFGYPNRGEAVAMAVTGFPVIPFSTLAPPVDSVRPSVSITSPAASSTISGTLLITAAAADNVGVAGVQFKADGANLGAEVPVAPYFAPWDTTRVSNGIHTVSAVARDAAGNLNTSAISAIVSNLVCNKVGINLFVGCYYGDMNFGNLKLVRTDPQINFNWGPGSPSTMIAPDMFSVRWQGYYHFTQAAHTFVVVADDGFRLYLDGVLILQHWVDEPATAYVVTTGTLLPGYHLIKLEYYEHYGSAVAQLFWF